MQVSSTYCSSVTCHKEGLLSATAPCTAQLPSSRDQREYQYTLVTETLADQVIHTAATRWCGTQCRFSLTVSLKIPEGSRTVSFSSLDARPCFCINEPELILLQEDKFLKIPLTGLLVATMQLCTDTPKPRWSLGTASFYCPLVKMRLKFLKSLVLTFYLKISRQARRLRREGTAELSLD